MATSILDLASSVAHQIQATLMLQHSILEITHPEDIVQPAKKLRFIQLHDKVMQESQRENALALKIMAVNESTPANAIDELMEELKTGSANGDDLATEILATVNAEIAEAADAVLQTKPVTQYKKVLRQLINPLYLADQEDKAKFTKVYDKISSANKTGNTLAASILSLTDITSDADIDQIKDQLEQAEGQGDDLAKEILDVINESIAKEPVRKLKKTLLLIANPISIADSQEREQYTLLRTKVTEASQKGNALATAILAIKETTTDDEMNQMLDQLLDAQSKKDEIALMIESLVGGNGLAAAPDASSDQGSTAQPDQTAGSQPQPTDAPSLTPMAPTSPAAPAGDAMPTPPPAAAPTYVTQNPISASLPPAQNSSGLFTPPPPPAQSAFSNTNVSQAVDNTPASGAVAGNGAMMQPQNAYSYSGLPASARPVNYVSPQTRQEEVE